MWWLSDEQLDVFFTSYSFNIKQTIHSVLQELQQPSCRCLYQSVHLVTDAVVVLVSPVRAESCLQTATCSVDWTNKKTCCFVSVTPVYEQRVHFGPVTYIEPAHTKWRLALNRGSAGSPSCSVKTNRDLVNASVHIQLINEKSSFQSAVKSPFTRRWTEGHFF